jgi:hypothetical protein
MTLKELKIQIDKTLQFHPDQEDDEVVIRVFDPTKAGPTPSVNVVSANAGFDWDRGTFFIFPLKQLIVKP